MKYINSNMRRIVRADYDTMLQKYFPDDEQWGVEVTLRTSRSLAVYDICRNVSSCSGEAWEHYAEIVFTNDALFVTKERNAEYEGSKKTLTFGRYRSFGGAVRDIARKGNYTTTKRHPIRIQS